MNIIPLPSNRVWRTYTGGKTLEEIAGSLNPNDGHFPEDWIASLTNANNPGRAHIEHEGLSKIMQGQNSLFLRQLIEQQPIKMLGRDHYKQYGATIAFLIKLLDSSTRLHFQCHPTAHFSKKNHMGNFGKTEGYYILGAREDINNPYIYLGFQHPPKKKILKEIIENQNIQELESFFEKIPVKKGDVFYVPGGLPHAIGEGIFMIEIMEPTDLVIRLEFSRAGYVIPEPERFLKKDINFGLSMINFQTITEDEVRQKYFIKPKLAFSSPTLKEYVLFDESKTNCFRMNKLEIDGDITVCKECFYILIVIGGTGTLQDEENTFSLKYGDKFFIPASINSIKISQVSRLELILAMPPYPA